MGKSKGRRGKASGSGPAVISPEKSASSGSSEQDQGGVDRGEFQRWETHLETTVRQRIFGMDVELEQLPNSNHLGTTVWDSSIVVVKYLEKNSKKGPVSKASVRGKRVLELGSGVGLGGIGAAMLGPAEVVMTDTAEVVPLIQRNIDSNLSPASLQARGLGHLCSSIPVPRVAELDWSSESQRQSYGTFDLVIAADCVYHPQLTADLYETLLCVTHKKSTVLMANEKRSAAILDYFHKAFAHHFRISEVPPSDLDPIFQDGDIKLYILKRTSQPAPHCVSEASEAGAKCAIGPDELHMWEALTLRDMNTDQDDEGGSPEHQQVLQASAGDSGGSGSLEDHAACWRARRDGAKAARLLKDVHIRPGEG